MLGSLVLDRNKKVTTWISTGISSEKTRPFDTNLQPTMSYLANGTVNLKFNSSILVQRSFSYFTLKNCLFGTLRLVRNTIKSKFTYNGQGIAFDGQGSWSFGNDIARNGVISGVDNTS